MSHEAFRTAEDMARLGLVCCRRFAEPGHHHVDAYEAPRVVDTTRVGDDRSRWLCYRCGDEFMGKPLQLQLASPSVTWSRFQYEPTPNCPRCVPSRMAARRAMMNPEASDGRR